MKLLVGNLLLLAFASTVMARCGGVRHQLADRALVAEAAPPRR